MWRGKEAAALAVLLDWTSQSGRDSGCQVVEWNQGQQDQQDQQDRCTPVWGDQAQGIPVVQGRWSGLEQVGKRIFVSSRSSRSRQAPEKWMEGRG